jgi:phosphohistidine phosphatase
MNLCLLRHGIAEPRAEPPDDRRELTPKGARRARAAARGLRALRFAPDAVLSSPVLRAAQTARIACEELGFPAERLSLENALRPDRSPEEILGRLPALGAESVLCVGHAPHLDRVLARAVAGRAEPIAALKKAGAACVELSPGSGGALRWLLEPRALRRLGR